MSLDISTRRAEAEAELERLQKEQAEAMLDGGRPQKAQGDVTRLRNELGILDLAEGIQSDRQRAEAERQRLARLAVLRSELAALEVDRLATVERAEMACRNLVDAINEMLDITTAEANVCHRINDDGPVPVPLMHHSIVSRISSRMASCFARLNGAPHRFGSVSWHFTGMPHHQQSWTEAETKILNTALGPLINGALPAPREKLLQIEHRKEDAINVNGSTGDGSQA